MRHSETGRTYVVLDIKLCTSVGYWTVKFWDLERGDAFSDNYSVDNYGVTWENPGGNKFPGAGWELIRLENETPDTSTEYDKARQIAY